MATTELRSFPPEVSEKLGCYVYRLIDPRNGETFYVGNGTGDRVFQHVRGKLESEESESNNKLTRIREIRNAGLEVGHIIHRHGMSKEVAIQVEAALIDAYPGLTNIVLGVDSSSFGAMHAKQVVSLYAAEEAVFKHHLLLINVNRSSADRDLFDATRYAWKLDPKNAEKAEFVLATVRGLIKGAFAADKWLDATPENFPGLGNGESEPGRFGFIGGEASSEIKELYVGKRVPADYRKPGAANPIRYTWQFEEVV